MDTSAHRLALVLALVAAAGLLVPTGAAQFLPSGPTDEVGEDVSLQPTDSGYAHLDDGELAIDVSASNPAIDAEGVNPGSVSTFDDVFVIHYGGDRYAEVWLTHGTDAITFSADGTPIETRANNVTLGPNQSVAVGMTVDATDPAAIERVDEFTVHSRVAEPPAGGDGGGGTPDRGPVVEVTESPGERVIEIRNAAAGESVDAEVGPLALGTGSEPLALDGVTVEHGSAGDSGIELAAVDPDGDDPAVATTTDATGLAPLGAVAVTPVDADAVDRVRLHVTAPTAFLEAHGTTGDALAAYRYDGGSWERLDVERSATDDGVALAIESERFSTVVVGAPTAAFDVTDVRANESDVTAGEAVAVTATVRNRGAANGSATVPLTRDGETVADRTVQVPAGETATLTVVHELNETGTHTLAAGDAPGVPVAVTAAETTTAGGATGAASTGTAEPTGTPTTTLVEEPAGIDLERIAGLGIAAALALGVVLLVRRRPIV